MVTLQTADNALKTFYLDALTEQIDTKVSPLLAMIEKTSAYVSGKGVSKVVRTGEKESICAGSETGELPKAKANEYVTFNAPLKNLYGTIEISDKAIRASANSEGAFVNLLNDEMGALIESAKDNFSRMIFGDGSGALAYIEMSNNERATVFSTKRLKAGMKIDLYANEELAYSDFTIVSINEQDREIVLEGDCDFAGTSFENMQILPAGATYGQELTGLNAIFSEKPLYGVDRTHKVMQPYVRSIGHLDELIIQKAIDEIEAQSGGKINVILCSRGVRRALLNQYYQSQASFMMIKMEGGASVMTFNGIPIIVDDYCERGKMYFLNTNDFKLCQLCDWQWMEGESGKILKQVAGSPVYSATLVKYAELICEKPYGQGVLIGVSEE